MRSGGHWSEPAAKRVLKALLAEGGEATTWQLAVGTRSVAVHQDIYSLRCWLQFVHGYDEADTHRAVETIHQGENDNYRQVVLYRLRSDVKRRAAELLDHDGTTKRAQRERQAAIFDC